MKLVAIVGTNSKRSTNRKLLQFMQKHFSDQVEIELLEISQLPAFNEPEDRIALTPVADFSEKILTADGVIIATPEPIPSALNSLLEWLSFSIHPLTCKPVMIVGASYDIQGSSRAQLHLRQILDAPDVNAVVMPGNEFLLGRAHQAFDEEGNLISQGTIDFLESCFYKFVRFATIANQLNEPEEVIFEPGTYSVTTVGHNGNLPMQVTLSEERIEKIDIDSSGESAGIADIVFSLIPAEIIEGQTLKEYKTYETDLVIVGGGGAGLAAAARALQSGKRVIVVEKFPSVGGNTVRAGGPMNAPDPAWQATFSANPGEAHNLHELYNMDESNIDAEYLEHFHSLKRELEEYLKDPSYLFDSKLLYRLQTYLGGKRTDLNGQEIHGNSDLVSVLTEHALESVRWLEDVGVEFVRDEVTMPVGALWRRGHKPKMPMGVAFISVLKDFVLKHGGIILTDTPVKELLVTDGTVTGVAGTGRNGQNITIHGKAVILTTSKHQNATAIQYLLDRDCR